MAFCGEIIYYMDDTGQVHSDICWHNDQPVTDEQREFFHKCLDEWLDRADGSGIFWLGNPLEWEVNVVE